MAGFGTLLRHWRETRGHSQRHLAEEAGMSTRHLSFLETERCGPSEQAVINLGRVLEIPEREVQRLLFAAGFAGDWNRQTCRVTPSQLAKVGTLLSAHDPFPAFITDPTWKISSCNRSGHSIFTRCVELNPALNADPFDIAEIVVDPLSIGRIVTNSRAILRGAMAGLFQLEPDPALFGNTSHLFERLAQKSPAAPSEALKLGPHESGAWETTADFEDLGLDFTLELLAIPFAGPCSGYGLLLMTPVDESHAERAREYFDRLMSRSCSSASREGSELRGRKHESVRGHHALEEN